MHTAAVSADCVLAHSEVSVQPIGALNSYTATRHKCLKRLGELAWGLAVEV